MKDKDYYIQYISLHKLIFIIFFFVIFSYFYRIYNYFYLKNIYYFVNVYKVEMKKSKVIFFFDGKEYNVILPQMLELERNCKKSCDEFFEKINFYFNQKAKTSDNIDIKILKKFLFKKDIGAIYIDNKDIVDILFEKFDINKIEDLN